MSDKKAPKTASNLSDAQAAPMLAALGSEVRLRLFRQLIRAGSEGMSVTGLQRISGIPPSTLGHHVTALVSTGLVSQVRQGRELICRAEYVDIRQLSAFLLSECCADEACVPVVLAAKKRDMAGV
ncbi:MAG: helix-turn-helix domain-containing protein [Pseudomonadota bacterium]|uniref:ArsR/SmtB family transcription factor n=1 Tax=Polaromonas sp. TaxID=1869339 RepID=UPI00182FB36D|nr:helix-turn-helix domain-containing protein [Polaromonas sp.]MBA3592855.1 helix-turn-helix transcriptional regulator [Polaromonas sp.]MDQ3272396.1 helix-turn-helix domain-containing protein [Pseudomonadota bacterium]